MNMLLPHFGNKTSYSFIVHYKKNHNFIHFNKFTITIYSFWLHPLHLTCFCHEFPTRNNDFVVVFMCIQLVNTIYTT